MSTVLPNLPQTPSVPAAASPLGRADVIIQNKINIPGWLVTLDDYRRWAESDEYPQSGWVSYLNDKIWVDSSKEELLFHNQVRHAFDGMFYNLFKLHPIGRYVPDRMLYVNEAVNLSTEPDGLFYLWPTAQSGRLRMIPGKKTGYVQLEGTPDGVLEIVSDSSVQKDVVFLRDLYRKAQIPEYWLVDARKDAIQFDILRCAKDAYQPSNVENGWVRSDVLNRWFRIERTLDPLGLAQYEVQVKE